ncbi:hypothetical protein [Burkholderia contaminans]|uniref:hypothetical protein n=1 Tax=Burkholderia contaminans TaxID=488447 RepID=UPI0039F707D0
MANRRFELFEYRQVLVRMRQGDSDRDIARGGLMGRKKLTTVRREAEARSWLDPVQPLPDDATIAGVFGRTPHLPDLSVILWAGHIMRCKSHGYADEEEKTNRSASGSGPRAAA